MLRHARWKVVDVRDNVDGAIYLVAKRQLRDTSIGTDCAGMVLQVDIDFLFRPGDRVCLVAKTSTRSIILIQAQAVIPISPRLSFKEAASVPNAQNRSRITP